MAQTFQIETLDRSGRWYLTPGAKSIYDLRIRNDSNNPLDCSLILEDPPAGVTVEPQSFALRGHEVRSVTVTIAADAPTPRSQRVFLTLRDSAGAVQASFEHPLIITGGTDCSISLAWKDALRDAGAVRSFELTCSVRSQSDGPTSFPLAFTPHPALTFPQLEPITLNPGESAELTIPVQWDPAITDVNGLNHPLLLEVGVPVSNGRRTSRMRWDAIDAQLQPFAWNSVLATVQSPAAGNGDGKVGAVAQTTATPDVSPVTEPAAVSEVSQEPKTIAAPAPASEAAPAVADVPQQAAPAANATNGKPASEIAAPAQTTQYGSSQPAPVPASTPEVTVHAASVENTKAVAELAAAADAFAASFASSETGFAEPSHREHAVASVGSPSKPYSQRRESRPTNTFPAALVIGVLAAIAIVVAGVLFRPSNVPPTPAVAPAVVNTPVVAANSTQPAYQPAVHAYQPAVQHPAAHKPAARNLRSKATAQAASPSPQPVATAPLIATTAPTTAGASVARAARPAQRTATTVAIPQAVTQQRLRQAFRRARIAAPLAGPVVALGGVEAHYGAGGRAVRVNWAAAEQSAANVQLIDERGSTLNSITVHGTRQSVLLYLPPRYRGSVTVQLTSTGRLGERVAQTAFLPPF